MWLKSRFYDQWLNKGRFWCWSISIWNIWHTILSQKASIRQLFICFAAIYYSPIPANCYFLFVNLLLIILRVIFNRSLIWNTVTLCYISKREKITFYLAPIYIYLYSILNDVYKGLWTEFKRYFSSSVKHCVTLFCMRDLSLVPFRLL